MGCQIEQHGNLVWPNPLQALSGSKEKVICEPDSTNVLNSPKFSLIVKAKTLVKSEIAINL